jgi:RHH-type transcriptional regulator, proline utilization regulon repressor / proline dehydrogenase / delta 1-pyrroline-5-carboxylate dehydrogenase
MPRTSPTRSTSRLVPGPAGTARRPRRGPPVSSAPRTGSRRRAAFVDLLVREAGKTLPDALAELREAVDLCRYYAGRRARCSARRGACPDPPASATSCRCAGAACSPASARGTSRSRSSSARSRPRSPPAMPSSPSRRADAAGRRRGVRLLHEAGVPADALQFVPGGPRLRRGARSGTRARRRRASPARPRPRRRSTARWPRATADRAADRRDRRPERHDRRLDRAAGAGGRRRAGLGVQRSAGQRCSALRLLFVQDDVADRVLEMLRGAMDELVIGDPAQPATDVGPVISARGGEGLDGARRRMRTRGAGASLRRPTRACARAASSRRRWSSSRDSASCGTRRSARSCTSPASPRDQLARRAGRDPRRRITG